MKNQEINQVNKKQNKHTNLKLTAPPSRLCTEGPFFLRSYPVFLKRKQGRKIKPYNPMDYKWNQPTRVCDGSKFQDSKSPTNYIIIDEANLSHIEFGRWNALVFAPRSTLIAYLCYAYSKRQIREWHCDRDGTSEQQFCSNSHDKFCQQKYHKIPHMVLFSGCPHQI